MFKRRLHDLSRYHTGTKNSNNYSTITHKQKKTNTKAVERQETHKSKLQDTQNRNNNTNKNNEENTRKGQIPVCNILYQKKNSNNYKQKQANK